MLAVLICHLRMLDYFSEINKSKMKRSLIICIASILLLSNACKQNDNKSFNIEVEKSSLAILDSQYCHHVQSQHVDSLISLYKADALLLSPGEAEITGHSNIKNWYQNAIEYGLRSCELKSTSVIGDEGYLIANGQCVVGLQLGDADTLVYERYKYLHVWEKQENGKYKLTRDIWNADRADLVE